ncbi:hypothetical protein ABEB36_014247 [Hypothenemus hampei]|uniref:PHD-type domain-containing protein n=1 Tax=Hypothenemus hampei TaxID=57062 RepID=A0ABD1E404_HYPHA
MSESRNFCVKCDEVLTGRDTEKMLKCTANSCNKGIHYTCSSYNTSELQFLESNKDHVKWFCGGCKNTNDAVKINL